MAKVSRITLAQHPLSEYLSLNHKLVFNPKELYSLIELKRNDWNLPATTTSNRIAQKWIENGFLKQYTFLLSDHQTEYPLYIFGEPSIYEIAVSLRPKSYISHYPAVFLHELTSQVPKTIYTTVELSEKRNVKPTKLVQASIDQAFNQPQRRSHLQTEYSGYTIVLLNGMFSNRNGVLLSGRYKNAFSITNVERTLIDITVRPNYAGGAFAVLDAYRRAIEGSLLQEERFRKIFDSTKFIYPYQQAIGFYLANAGYEGNLLAYLNSRKTKFNFYLDYAINNKVLDSEWKVWHPKGM